MNQPPFETCPMVAKRWGVSRAFIHQLVMAKRLVAQKVGRDWIIQGYPQPQDFLRPKRKVVDIHPTP